MTQQLKVLKHRDLSSNPQNAHKSQVCSTGPIVPAIPEEDKRLKWENPRKMESQLAWCTQCKNNKKRPISNKIEGENQYLRLSSDLYS